MRDNVRSYFVFTSLLYRIAMYAVMPAVVIGIGVLISSGFDRGMAASFLVAGVTVGELLTALEIISDVWLFGGIQKKEGANLEYLKTSGRGRRVIRAALVIELVRKFFTAVCVMAVCTAVLAYRNGGEVGSVAVSLLYIALMSYFFSVLGTFVARFWDMFWTNVLVCYVAAILYVLCLLIPVWDKIAAVAVLGVLCIIVSVAAVKMPLRRMEGSYYDK